MPGTLSYSYRIDSDTDWSVIARLIVRHFDAAGSAVHTDTVSYRLTLAGSITKLGEDIAYANGVRLVITARAG